MDESFSLEYYDRIFGHRGPEFWELMLALEEQLESYADDLGPVLAARDRRALTRLRHSHRPLVLNLKLNRLHSLEAQIAEAVEQGTSNVPLDVLSGLFQEEAHNLAHRLAKLRQAL